MDNKTVYAGIFVIALIVCLLSPFLASGDPDGLEKSAENIGETYKVAADALEADSVISPIMPDYNFPTENEDDASPIGGVICLVIGAILTVALAYGVFYLATKHE